MKKVVITGANGHMGKVIADIIEKRDDCEIIAGIDLNTKPNENFTVYKSFSELSQKPDVIIDFSHPSVLDDLLAYCKANKVAAVIGTTGYTAEQKEQIKAAASDIPVFFTFNMSLGVNLLASLAQQAVKILGGQFDIEILEKHHNQKIDAPSGTALMLADAINAASDIEYEYVYDRHSVRKKREAQELGISAIRGGTIVGEHDIIFAGRDEVITLSHSAASKSVFAVGAVNAAVFVSGKPNGLYDMQALIAES
ncbi:MAG: 4-hydroxy-tetrahydrodipicolinate reductase [Oscillospiraceae bacterium]|nr:4-hydroxy-tetrahydrodipicolinate reductase [Oscillospiraceae bacterium]